MVLADLTVQGQRKGPQAFIMDFRKDGQPVDGVSAVDMGRKTVGNDLHNARIHFDSVQLPKSAMLSRYAEIDEGGGSRLKSEGVRPFDMIGPRLYTGRVAVAQAAGYSMARAVDYSVARQRLAAAGRRRRQAAARRWRREASPRRSASGLAAGWARRADVPPQRRQPGWQRRGHASRRG